MRRRKLDFYEDFVYEELPDRKAGIVRYEGDDEKVTVPAVIPEFMDTIWASFP